MHTPRTLPPVGPVFRRLGLVAALALGIAALALSACGSGGLGDILGPTTDPTVGPSEIRGTVDRVDTRNRQIVLVDASQRQLGSSLQNDAPLDNRDSSIRDRLAIDYDAETYVEFEGQRYTPANLERGDRIVAVVDESRNRYVARSIEVTYDSTPDDGSGDDRWGDEGRWEAPSDEPWEEEQDEPWEEEQDEPREEEQDEPREEQDDDRWEDERDDDRWAAQVEGTVRSVDTGERTLILEREGTGGGGWGQNLVEVRYDAWTRVEYRGQVGRVENLERGDRVVVRSRDDGQDPVAEQIEVLTSVSHDERDERQDRGNDAWTGDTLRARVIGVDSRARIVEVERETSGWGSRSRGATVRLYYDDRTTVEYRGRSDYRPENLERGDLVEIDVRRVGDGYLAEEILVVESVSG